MPATLRSLVRRVCNLSGTAYPITVVPGDSAPRLVGRSYYWTTLSGKTVVHHAYGWPTLYHRSTRRIEVGAAWLSSAIG